ncbi:hypothetical protein J8J27_33070, partial [Mycobacterium tuberculosis]|nr:hypothetical protein [Mycobacterium tuberculosis]
MSPFRPNRWAGAIVLATSLAVIAGGVLSEALLYRQTFAAAERDMASLARLFIQNAEDTVDLADS